MSTHSSTVAGILNEKTSIDFRKAQWLMLFLTILAYLFYYNGRQNFGFAIIGIQHDFGLNAVDTGTMGAAMLIAYGLGQAINGQLGDRFGARILLPLGALLSCLLNFLCSCSVGFWTLLIPWCLNGYAQSLGFAPGTRLLANWWDPNEQGQAFGWFLFSSGVSTVIAFAACSWIANHYAWPWLFRLPVLILLPVALVFYRYARDTPEALNYTSPHAAQIKTRRQEKTISLLAVIELLKQRQFTLACLAMGFASIARNGLLFWVPVYYMQLSSTQVWMTTALPVGMALGSVINGMITDKYFYNRRGLNVVGMMLASSLLVFCLFQFSTTLNLTSLILLILAGFCIYGPQTPLFAMCPQLLGQDKTATGVGLMNAYAYSFAALGEVGIGYVIHRTGQTSMLFLVVTVSCLISALLALYIKE